MNRYARQIAVPELGPAGHARLRDAHVLVIGAGGLAAPVLQYLAGAGVGRIRLVDPDVVEAANLPRQTLFATADIGKPKAQAAARTLARHNPDVAVEPVVAAFAPGSATDLAADTELVLDCADSFAASYIASDRCRDAGLPLVSASVVGTEGYAGGFCGSAPSLRAVFPDLPRRLGSCAEDGVLGPVVGVVGAIQAQMALAVLAGMSPSPLGRIVTYDGLAHRSGGFAFHGAPEPATAPRFLDPGEITAADWIADLRAPSEGPLAHPSAHRLPVETFGPGGPAPAPGQRAILCCRSGQRSWTAAEALAARWEGEIALVALG